MENLIESDLVNCHLWKVENPNAKCSWWWNIEGTILENVTGYKGLYKTHASYLTSYI